MLENLNSPFVICLSSRFAFQFNRFSFSMMPRKLLWKISREKISRFKTKTAVGFGFLLTRNSTIQSFFDFTKIFRFCDDIDLVTDFALKRFFGSKLILDQNWLWIKTSFGSKFLMDQN